MSIAEIEIGPLRNHVIIYLLESVQVPGSCSELSFSSEHGPAYESVAQKFRNSVKAVRRRLLRHQGTVCGYLAGSWGRICCVWQYTAACRDGRHFQHEPLTVPVDRESIL